MNILAVKGVMEISNTWKKHLISDLGEIVGGGTPKTSVSMYWGGNTPWVTPRDMSQQSNKKYISEGERYITTIGLNNSSAKLLPKGTVLFTSRAPIGYIGIVIQDLATNQGFKSIIVNEENSNEFVYYLLKHSLAKIINSAGGSTFKEINTCSFKQIEVEVPILPIQQKIAAILSSLDNKIENNRKTCEKLEEIAQTIFKQWFVDFEFPNEDGKPYKSSGGKMEHFEELEKCIPLEWGKGFLGDIGTIVGGSTPSKRRINYYKDGNIPWITPRDLSKLNGIFIGKGEFFITEEGYNSCSTKLLEKGSILFTSRSLSENANKLNINLKTHRNN